MELKGIFFHIRIVFLYLLIYVEPLYFVILKTNDHGKE